HNSHLTPSPTRRSSDLFSDTLSNSKSPDASRVLKDARISLSSGIVDVTIRAPRIQFSAIVKELSDIAAQLSEFPHIFPLSNSIKDRKSTRLNSSHQIIS